MFEEGDDQDQRYLEKERNYNLRTTENRIFFRKFLSFSTQLMCFQINKRYIPKYLSILRVIDRQEI